MSFGFFREYTDKDYTQVSIGDKVITGAKEVIDFGVDNIKSIPLSLVYPSTKDCILFVNNRGEVCEIKGHQEDLRESVLIKMIHWAASNILSGTAQTFKPMQWRKGKRDNEFVHIDEIPVEEIGSISWRIWSDEDDDGSITWYGKIVSKNLVSMRKIDFLSKEHAMDVFEHMHVIMMRNVVSSLYDYI